MSSGKTIRLPLTQMAHDFVRTFVSPGDIVIDATIGNGFDTLYLCQLVGEQGIVYGFDVQAAAIKATRQHCCDFYNSTYAQTNKLRAPQLKLIEKSHCEMMHWVDPVCVGAVSAVMFNLGYLPKSEKSIKTRPHTTLKALDVAFDLLKKPGCISVLAYTGHDGGQEEAQLVQQHLQKASEMRRASLRRYPTQDVARSPILFTFSVGRKALVNSESYRSTGTKENRPATKGKA